MLPGQAWHGDSDLCTAHRGSHAGTAREPGGRWVKPQGSPQQGHRQEDCHRSTEERGRPGLRPLEVPLEQSQGSHS